MKLENLPIWLGALVALVGLALFIDSVQTDGMKPFRERRRRMRAERNRLGEGVVALGTLCMAASLMGRDTWRYSTILAIAGMVLIVFGALLNLAYLKELLLFRGAARRMEDQKDGVAKGSSETSITKYGLASEDPLATQARSETPKSESGSDAEEDKVLLDGPPPPSPSSQSLPPIRIR